MSVRVDLEGTILLNKNYRAKRTGIRRRAEPIDANHTAEIPSGAHLVQVLVASENQAGKMFRKNMTVRDGQTHRLDVSVSESGEVSVTLN